MLARLLGSPVSDSAMWAVLIVLLQIPADIFSRFPQVTILRTPDLLFLQAAMESLDIAAAFRVMVVFTIAQTPAVVAASMVPGQEPDDCYTAESTDRQVNVVD